METTRTGLRITVERPSEKRLQALRVSSWPIWTKGPSTFEWHYEEREMCYLLEGEVIVKTDGDEVVIREGDLATFPKGLACTWHVTEAIRKHYHFG